MHTDTDLYVHMHTIDVLTLFLNRQADIYMLLNSEHMCYKHCLIKSTDQLFEMKMYDFSPSLTGKKIKYTVKTPPAIKRN